MHFSQAGLGQAKEYLWGRWKFKKDKLQDYSMQFERVHMKEEEDIETYFLQVYLILNSIKRLGETIEEETIVQKIMTILPPHFNSKVSVLVDISNMAIR